MLPGSKPDHRALRQEMVRRQLAARGIRDERVLAAMERVPREEFVPAPLASQAHEDTPLPSGGGQTISQPYMVAYMTEALALRGDERVLDVGTGSGYQAAILAELAGEVFTVERDAALAADAAAVLSRLGYTHVACRHGDGRLGLPEAAPFHGIVVAAAARSAPPALLAQLAPGGRLVLPLEGERGEQVLVLVERRADGLARRELSLVRFVPLVPGTC